MKRSLLVLLSLVMMIAFLVLPHNVFAQSKQVAQPSRPLSTIPYCYGDGWGSYQPCDGLPSQNPTNCPKQLMIDSKAIGSQSQGQIGHLDIYFTGNTGEVPLGCNAWWAGVTITHSGCYSVNDEYVVENGADFSTEGYADGGQLCKGHTMFTRLTGDWQPGGCYYAFSDVFAGTDQDTSTITSCY